MKQSYAEYIQELKTKKIAVIGLGVSNIPLIKVLATNKMDITVFDQKELENMSLEVRTLLEEEKIKTSFGKNYLDNLRGFDVIFRSPSLLPTNKYLKAEEQRGAVITTEIEQVIRLTPGIVIGVTGSKGKTTTTTIISNLLTNLGYKTYLGGNIGTPLFSKLEEMKKDDFIVLELSSFQLMGMKVSPHIAVITNISPDHLDVHSSYEEYIMAKKNIFLKQKKDDILVLNASDEIVCKFRDEAKEEVRYFNNKKDDLARYYLTDDMIKGQGRSITTKNLLLKGKHNYLNICAALSACDDFIKVDDSKLQNILENIKSVPHRLEFIREINNVKWYNDSASTTPDKAIAGIRSFAEDIVLIAGGSDKNISYAPLAKPILEKVSKLILFGTTKDKIKEEVQKLSFEENKEIPIYIGNSLEEVVDIANKVSRAGEVVLFSPASASFDMFKNAYQRGDIFRDLVNKIKDKV